MRDMRPVWTNTRGTAPSYCSYKAFGSAATVDRIFLYWFMTNYKESLSASNGIQYRRSSPRWRQAL